MNQFVVDYLNRNFKYHITKDTEIYDKIDLWKSYYKDDAELHKYTDNYGKTRYSYGLGMAKRISEDWASIGFTEKDEISVNKNNNKKFIKDFIEEVKLNNEIPKAIETSTWSGTCGCIIRLKNISVVNKKIVATDKTNYDLIMVNARNILPLRIEHGDIIDVAFISGIRKVDKKLIYMPQIESEDTATWWSILKTGVTRAIIPRDKIITKNVTVATKSLFPLFLVFIF